ncbi:START-like domain-containing protein [Artemisia annua]|uniref:START-like domain-containing protein n=1 Tax=Artemisia annua TaxID=35608 RepID=A0A2U1P513_ARTAN|nr:START-like domain-containing protein [Artemisia annua]
MIKESEVVEGVFLDLGCNFYKNKFEIKDNPNGQSCLLKFKVEYDTKEEFAVNAFSYHHGAIHCFNKFSDETFDEF